MNTKDNARSHQTKKKIQEAFLEILRETNLEKVNVKAICDKVNINRSSFYYYYEDIYALAAEIQTQIHLEIIELFGTKRVNFKDDIIHGQNKRDAIIQLLELIKNNQNFFNLYFMNRFSVQAFEGMTYKECFYTAGIRALASQWIDRGCVESVADMADIVEEILL